VRRFPAFVAISPAALALVAGVSPVVARSSLGGAAQQVSVAYITDLPTPAGPHDFRGVALLGFQRAVREFHIQARVVQFNPRQGPGPTLMLLGRQRYDLIIIGEVQALVDVDTLTAVARSFPQSTFVLSDPPLLKRWPENVQGAIWHVEQPAYLAGYLAALMERRRPGRDVVGSVGGFPIISVNSFIAGFEAGAKKADAGVKTLRRYAYSFSNTGKCRSVTLGEIAAGAGAVFNVAGECGPAILAAAKERDVWGIGVDVDQSFLGPHILTSVVKRFDAGAYETVKAFVQGRLKTGGNAVWTLRNGAVGLGKISAEVPRSFVRRVERIRQQIIAGKIKIPPELAG
jgi:basic membrane protein A and related proteins